MSAKKTEAQRGGNREESNSDWGRTSWEDNKGTEFFTIQERRERKGQAGRTECSRYSKTSTKARGERDGLGKELSVCYDCSLRERVLWENLESAALVSHDKFFRPEKGVGIFSFSFKHNSSSG